MTAKLGTGTFVRKNPDTWEPNDFDSWGRGVGVGVVVEAPFDVSDLDIVDVRWPAGRCFEKVQGLQVIMDSLETHGLDPSTGA